jgi:hypothetical protein
MNDSGQPLIVAAAGDAGGAAAVLPVIQFLSSSGTCKVQTLAYRQAATLFSKRNVPFRQLEESFNLGDAIASLSSPAASMLLCGTSVNDLELEKPLIDAANRLRIPSLAVLDYWSNYAARFSQGEGDLAHLPSRIAVMDQSARTEMIAEGFDPERLVVTGQPAFDDLEPTRSRFNDVRRQTFRQEIAIAAEQILVTFFSQPLSAGFGKSGDSNPRESIGYDERIIMPAVIETLAVIARRRTQEIALAIRPHPRESIDWYRSLSTPDPLLRLLVTTEGESREWAMASHLVAGMTSVILVEACFLGCPVVSVQTGLKGRDVLPTNRLGLSRAVYHLGELDRCIDQLLFDDSARSALRTELDGLQNTQGATQRIVSLIDQMIGFPLIFTAE